MFETFTTDNPTGFKGRGNRGQRPAAVGIAKQGVFTINPAAYELLDKPSFVELLFDKVNKKVGIKAVEKPSNTAFDIRPFPNGLQHRINARRFTRHYGIKPSQGKPFKVEKVGDIISFDVETETEDGN